MPHGQAGSKVNPEINIADAATEWDTLTTALNRWGVLHVSPGRPRQVGIPRTAVDLCTRLMTSAEPRLQQAVIPLLMTHPMLAVDARAAIAHLEGTQRDRAMRRYVAAAAMQRMARTRLTHCLGTRQLLPPCFLADLGLPSLDEDFGQATLWALAEQEQIRYGYDAWGTYHTLLDLLLSEMRRGGWGEICDSAPTKLA
ncbi:MAG: hypothetical protein ACRDJH_17125 [Thermomicrobiales bacterium]